MSTGFDVEWCNRVEARTRRLEERMLELERGTLAAPEVPRWIPPPTPAAPAPPVRPAASPRPRSARPQAPNLEDLLGGRVLAWVGGAAVIIGLAYFFALAVSNGWIGEAARTLMAGCTSTGFLALGVWLHERRGRTDAALTAVSAGACGLFMTAAVATTKYELIPAGAGLALALVAGAIATFLAVRWRAQVIAAIGIVGAILAPVLVGAPPSAQTVALVFVAAASAVGVLVHQRWNWLAFTAVLLTVPQWGEWLFGLESVSAALLVLVAFGGLGVGAAVGFELRTAAAGLPKPATFLLTLNAMIMAVAGWFSLALMSEGPAAELWLCGLAFAHLLVGLAAHRSRRVSHALGLVSLTVGVVLADVAFATIAGGPVLAVGWALSGLGFAALLKVRRLEQDDAALAGLGVGGHIGLGLLNAIVVHAPPQAIAGAQAPGTAIIVLASVVAACFGSALLAAEHPRRRAALNAVGLAVTAYLMAVALDGTALVAALAAEACVLAAVARHSRDRVVTAGAIAYLGAATAHLLAVEAPPVALIEGVADPRAAALCLLALGAAAARFAHLRTGGTDGRAIFGGGAALILLYLASVLIIDRYQPGELAAASGAFDLGVRQHGQTLLSALWSVAGVTALVFGLRADLRPVRLGALALLTATVTKVFLYDLATLTAGYRVASFIGLGVLLLGGAHAYQRMRPRPLDDLGDAPAAVR